MKIGIIEKYTSFEYTQTYGKEILSTLDSYPEGIHPLKAFISYLINFYIRIPALNLAYILDLLDRKESPFILEKKTNRTLLISFRRYFRYFTFI